MTGCVGLDFQFVSYLHIHYIGMFVTKSIPDEVDYLEPTPFVIFVNPFLHHPRLRFTQFIHRKRFDKYVSF